MRRATASTTDSAASESNDSLRKEPTVSPELEEQIRQRAFELYELRGMEEGHALDDWLQAEAEFETEHEGIAA